MISPRSCQILRGKRGVCAQQIRLAGSEPPCLDEQPDRDARAHDARFTAADAGRRLDARKCLVEVIDDPAQDLRLFVTFCNGGSVSFEKSFNPAPI